MKGLNDLKKYLLKRFDGFSDGIRQIVGGFIEKLYKGDRIFARSSKGDATPVRMGSIIPVSIYTCCNTVCLFLKLGARKLSNKKQFNPFEQDIDDDITLCKQRGKSNDPNINKHTFKYTKDVRKRVRWWLAYLTELENCPEDRRQKLYETAILMPKANKCNHASHGRVFMSPVEVRKVLKIIKHVVPWYYSEYYTALCALRLCGGRPGSETYGTYIDDLELDENGFLADYMFGCGRWDLPAKTSKQGNSPSHPYFGTPIFPYARILINKHLKSKFMQKYIQKCKKKGIKPLLFPPLMNVKKRGGIGSFSDRVYGDKFLRQKKYRDAISVALDQSHKSMYLVANDFRRTCAHLIENIELKPIIRILRKMGEDVSLKHTLLKIISYMELRHSLDDICGDDAHSRSYTCQDVGQEAFYFVVSKAFEFLMCDLANTEEEAEQKFNDWIKTYYWPEEWDEPVQNNSNNVHQNTGNGSVLQKQLLDELIAKKEAIEQELNTTINDGSISVRVKRQELSEKIQKLTTEIEKIEGVIKQ